jgi:tetratricopeptide (TPR) repeat protein
VVTWAIARRAAAGALALGLTGTASGLGAEPRLDETVRRAADLHRRGAYAEAENATAEALRLLESRRGPADFEAAFSLNDLAALAYAQGNLDRAAQLFEQSRDAYRALAGPDDPRLATAQYNLAGVYLEQGNYAQAEQLYRNALAIREKALGPFDPLAIEIWNDLGFLLLQQGKYKDAESWFEKARDVWENTRGSEVYQAIALNNLAQARKMQGDFTGAATLYQRALAVEETAFGQNHPEVATTLLNLAALERARASDAEARRAYERAIAILDRTVGAQDPLAAEAREQLRKLPATGESGEYQILVVQTRGEAETLHRRIEQGENFAELAKRYSIDPNGPTGGYFRAAPAELRDELRAEVGRIRPGELGAVFPLAGKWAFIKRRAAAAPARP